MFMQMWQGILQSSRLPTRHLPSLSSILFPSSSSTYPHPSLSLSFYADPVECFSHANVLNPLRAWHSFSRSSTASAAAPPPASARGVAQLLIDSLIAGNSDQSKVQPPPVATPRICLIGASGDSQKYATNCGNHSKNSKNFQFRSINLD